MLPTPRSTDHHDSLTAPAARRHVEAGNGTLPESLGYHLLPTPRAGDGTKGGPNQHGSSGDLMLPSAVQPERLLQTPSVSDGTGGHLNRGSERSSELLLPGQAAAMTTSWGIYEPAVRRWESLTRPAPAPTEPNTKGNPRLSPPFVEWMQGLDEGHVTDPEIGLTRNQQLKALGNGVVPAQAAEALRRLLVGWLPVVPSEPVDKLPALLPTPNPFHMGNTEEPEAWRARRLDVFQRTGTRHGPALSVVALSIAQGAPLDPSHYMPDEDEETTP